MDKASQYLSKAEILYLYFRRDAAMEGQRLYREAIKLAPPPAQLAQLHAELAYSQLTAWLYNWDPNMQDLDEALSNVDEAVRLDPDDYYNHWIAADVHLYLRDFDTASKLYDDVRAMAATQAIEEEIIAIQVDRADMLLLTGDAAGAISEVEKAISNSAVPEKWFYWVLGWAYYVDGQYQKSFDVMEQFFNPRNAMRKNVIANLVALNKLSQAEHNAHHFLEEEKEQGITYAAPGQPVWPGLEKVEDRLPFKDVAQLDAWKDRLRQAFQNIVQL